MEKPNPLREKSYLFALNSISFSRTLTDKKEYVLSKQFLKSATSIGANIEEALQGQSKKDFIAKLSIALKEAFESHYWLRLLKDSGLTSQEETQPLLVQVEEIMKLLTAIIKTSKQ